MAALANILPLTFLGSFCFLVLTLLAYFCWRKSRARRTRPHLENPEYEVEEIPGTNDFVMVGRKGHRKRKVKKPKLWDIWISNLGFGPTHERKPSSGSSFSDPSVNKEFGLWADLKPITVTYVKNSNKAHIPPVPIPTTRPSTDPASDSNAIVMDDSTFMGELLNPSQTSLSQPPSRDVPPDPSPEPPPADTLAMELTSRTSNRKKRESMGGYDKSTIEAVQVSVLIAMPQRPATRRHATESVSPLELGVVHVPLGHSAPRWAARQSIRPPPQ